MFKRQTINRQISNILSGEGIDTAGIPDTCAFAVDPYSYYISVDGVDGSLKQPMEQALNQSIFAGERMDKEHHRFRLVQRVSAGAGLEDTHDGAESPPRRFR